MRKVILSLLTMLVWLTPALAVQQAYHNQVIAQDRDFEEYYQYLSPTNAPINLTGYTVAEQMVDNAGKVYFNATPYISISSPTQGMIHILIPAAINQSLTPTTPQYSVLYDIKLTGPSGQVPPFMQGAVQLLPSVTQ